MENHRKDDKENWEVNLVRKLKEKKMKREMEKRVPFWYGSGDIEYKTEAEQFGEERRMKRVESIYCSSS